MTDFILPPDDRAYMPEAKSQVHLTPQRVVTPLHRFCQEVAGDPFPDLDPCGADGDLVLAHIKFMLTRGEDGLVLPWSEHEIVYVNPPYESDQLAAFTNKCRRHRMHGTAIALLPAQKCEKVAWQRDVFPVAAKICFIDGRLTFHGASNQAPFPSAIALWTRNDTHVSAFMDAFGDVGSFR